MAKISKNIQVTRPGTNGNLFSIIELTVFENWKDRL